MQKQILNKIYLIFLCLVFVFAFLLRIKFYIQAPSMWHDECSLGINIFSKNFFGFFGALDNTQSAPPLFMAFTKMLTNILGIKESVFRLIPFISSICSIPVFYLFSKRFIYNRWIVLIANILFAINYHLLLYTGEFKQYSSDIVIFMSTFLLLEKLDLTSCSSKRLIAYSILMIIISQFSLPVIFLFAGFVLISGFNKDMIKRESLLFLPSIFLIAIYSLLQNPESIAYFKIFWNNGFITFTNIPQFIKDNFNYWFSPNTFLTPELILFTAGLACLTKDFHKKNAQLMLSTLALIILASILRIYPLMGRVGLYLIPSVIIILLYPFNFTSLRKKIITGIIILITLLSFSGYNLSYAERLISKNTIVRPSGNFIMQNLALKYTPEDIVMINSASVSDYTFFVNYYNFYPARYGIVNTPDYNKNQYYKMLDSLPAGKYWFYYAYDISKTPVIPWLKEWKNNKKVLFELQDGSAYLLYLNLK